MVERYAAEIGREGLEGVSAELDPLEAGMRIKSRKAIGFGIVRLTACQ